MSISLSHSLIFLLIFTSCFAQAVNTRKAKCETELSRRARVVINLVKRSLELDIASISDWREYLKSEDPSPPLTYLTRDVGNLSVANEIRKNFSLLSEPEKGGLRAAIGRVLNEKEAQLARVKEVSEQTAQIFVPKMKRQMRAPFPLTNPASQLYPGRLHGRPVFVGLFRNGNTQWIYVLLDPTNPIPAMRVRKLHSETYMGSGGLSIRHAVILTLRGKTYFLCIDKKMILDLEDPTQEPQYFFRASREWYPWSNSILVVDTPHGKKMLMGTENPSILGELDLNRLTDEPKALAEGQFDDFREDNLGNETVISVANLKGEIWTYASENGEAKLKLEFAHVEERGNVQHHIFYRDHERDFISFFEAIEYQLPVVHKLVIIERGAKTPIYSSESFQLKSHPHFFRGANGPALAFFSEKGLVIADLRTKTMQVRVPGRVSERASLFFWKHTYLTWISDQSGEINFYDLEDDQLTVVPGLGGGTLYPISHYDFQGEKYALVQGNYGLPHILQITYSGEGGAR